MHLVYFETKASCQELSADVIHAGFPKIELSYLKFIQALINQYHIIPLAGKLDLT